MSQVWYVYLIRCADDTLYTGVTTDTARRVEEHNASSRGAKYTRTRRPVLLVHTESYETRSAACRREAELKGLTRDEKRALIAS